MRQITEFLKTKNINKEYINGKYDNDSIYDIIIASYLSIIRKKSYIGGQVLGRDLSNVDYNDIKEILNKHFNYSYTDEDIDTGRGQKAGHIIRVFRDYKKKIIELVRHYEYVTITINGEISKVSWKELNKKYNDILNRK